MSQKTNEVKIKYHKLSLKLHVNFLILTLYPYKLTLSTFDFNNKFSNNKIIILNFK